MTRTRANTKHSTLRRQDLGTRVYEDRTPDARAGDRGGSRCSHDSGTVQVPSEPPALHRPEEPGQGAASASTRRDQGPRLFSVRGAVAHPKRGRTNPRELSTPGFLEPELILFRKFKKKKKVSFFQPQRPRTVVIKT